MPGRSRIKILALPMHPNATLLLDDLGAKLKDPKPGSSDPKFLRLQSDKKSITLDMKRREGE